ncbi:hypothetical protein [Streptomyces roseochromogenus]|uniref:Uncharacterized protein n=1 Tax=Streptomyces roseochromogenus subsp. oscitans DS 12.976 TaxID=1352936 RepID=V6KPE1_STRRC|nr:hypothetical protein [Streptomyces roseochromogenus]EST33271.1 hypothetical protein M878_13285 [Streptomyces roseochromogenus subsp. oscitans DS 12.976]
MDIVYASLPRRPADDQPPLGETAEVLGALWAHAVPDDGLEHVTCRAELDRVDLLLFLLTRNSPDAASRTALHRAGSLLTRCHQASPLLRERYLAPQTPAEAPDGPSR